MTLRTTLLSVLSVFGLILLSLLGLEGWRTNEAYREVVRNEALQETRSALLRASLALQNDRQILIADRAGLDPARFVRGVSDTPGAAADASIAAAQAALPAAGADLAQAYNGQIDALRASLRTENDERTDIAAIEAGLTMIKRLRIQLLGEDSGADLPLSLMHLLRSYGLVVNDRLSDTADLVLPRVGACCAPLEDDVRAALGAQLAQLHGAASVLDGLIDQFALAPVDQALALAAFLAQDYALAQERLIDALAAADPARVEAVLIDWLDCKYIAEERIAALFDTIEATSQGRIAEMWIETTRARDFTLGLALLVGGLYLAAAAGVWTAVASPLEKIQKTMLRLALGDLSRIPQMPLLIADLRLMNETLRVFRVNAIKRERLQQERTELHSRISSALSELRAEMEAAAALQRSQLPTPGQYGAYRLRTLFRPSRFLAGDTYDFVPLQGGGLRVFQVDVTGHSAAASLVSVAAHVALKRALELLPPGAPLTEAIEAVNADWSDDLPNFTALVAELDPTSRIGRMVQAGHPWPAVLRPGKGVERIGRGGLPIGVLRPGDYEEVRFDFGPQDRLVVFSDGVYDLANPKGEEFGEDRFTAFLAAQACAPTDAMLNDLGALLSEWGQSDEPDDDMTIFVAERTTIDDV